MNKTAAQTETKHQALAEPKKVRVKSPSPTTCWAPDLRTVAVLFARRDSNYKTLPGVDVWDFDRDARDWPGGCPVVAHPPCRGWGRLRAFAAPEPGELQYALDCIDRARRWGGVVEHPDASLLWRLIGAKPGELDKHGGWLLPIHQNWWGHRAEKSTMLYVVGCAPKDTPDMPMTMAEPTHVVQSRKRTDHRPHISKAEREHTPPALTKWLVELARRCVVVPNAKAQPPPVAKRRAVGCSAMLDSIPHLKAWMTASSA